MPEEAPAEGVRVPEALTPAMPTAVDPAPSASSGGGRRTLDTAAAHTSASGSDQLARAPLDTAALDTLPTTPGDASGRATAAAFAADLRRLRLDSGSPTLHRLQHDSGVSRTVISEALGGRRLPTARTVDRIVRALGAEPDAWVDRRDRIATEHRDGTTDEPRDAAATVVEPTPPPVPVVRRRSAVLLAAAALAIGLLGGAAIGFGVGGATAGTVINPRAQINVATGADPALTPCVDDAKVATAADRDPHTRIEIIWSNKCYAGWARVTRYDENWAGNSLTVAIYPETAPHGPDRQTATEPDVQGGYTTLLVRPTPQTRLCAVGSVTSAGTTIDLGEPICI